MKNIQNQIRGEVNKAQGNLFEQYISEACERYKERGIACIDKTPEPMRIIKSLGSGKFIAHFQQAAQPDYKGTLRHGRAIAFEAKLTSSDRITQDRVTMDQAQALEQHFNMGAMCFVLVSLDFEDVYRVPWATWRSMKKLYGHKYMTATELEPYRVHFTGQYVDFLEGG